MTHVHSNLIQKSTCHGGNIETVATVASIVAAAAVVTASATAAIAAGVTVVIVADPNIEIDTATFPPSFRSHEPVIAVRPEKRVKVSQG